MTSTINEWRKNFPFQSVRSEQEQAINFILDALKSEGKRFAIIDAGTGIGKSALGVTASRSLGSAYILTTQKVLQEQYMNDFGPTKLNIVQSIKSSTNYTCTFESLQGAQTCGESRRLLEAAKRVLAGTPFHDHCKTECPYKLLKQEFLEGELGITNFSYFLAETMYVGSLKKRDVLVIDEAHNTELELSKFIEVMFSEKFAHDVLKIKPPIISGKTQDEQQDQVFDWVKNKYEPALKKYISTLSKAMTKKFMSDVSSAGDLIKKHDALDKHICKVHRFIEKYDQSNWVLNIVWPPAGSKRGQKKYEFKPIDVSQYSEEMLFSYGDKVIMMSATILDRDEFCRSLGIDLSEVAFLRIPSPFHVENRPIHYIPVGSMSKNNIDATLPKMAETVKMLLEQHPDVKGLIHTTNFKIAKYIVETLNDPRLLIHDSSNREHVLKQHIASPLPTVLISPSMMEGIDLSDDSSRFQIICKVPFPYLGDKATKKRMSKSKSWYPYQTAKSIIQSFGRSVRNQTDHATTYILDQDWAFFFEKNKNMFPDDIVKAIVN